MADHKQRGKEHKTASQQQAEQLRAVLEQLAVRNAELTLEREAKQAVAAQLARTLEAA